MRVIKICCLYILRLEYRGSAVFRILIQKELDGPALGCTKENVQVDIAIDEICLIPLLSRIEYLRLDRRFLNTALIHTIDC